MASVPAVALAAPSALDACREDVRVAQNGAQLAKLRVQQLRERAARLPDGYYRRTVEGELACVEAALARAMGEEWSGLRYVERLLHSAASGEEWAEVEHQAERNLGVDRG